MYVSLSSKPIDTQTLIYQHDAAFRYFGGCLRRRYDQSKLVVISETFRELELNERFHQYATTAGFNIRACEGYDPESKGKVESGVKYVQQNGLYGEEFKDWQGLESYIIGGLTLLQINGCMEQHANNQVFIMSLKSEPRCYPILRHLWFPLDVLRDKHFWSLLKLKLILVFKECGKYVEC